MYYTIVTKKGSTHCEGVVMRTSEEEKGGGPCIRVGVAAKHNNTDRIELYFTLAEMESLIKKYKQSAHAFPVDAIEERFEQSPGVSSPAVIIGGRILAVDDLERLNEEEVASRKIEPNLKEYSDFDNWMSLFADYLKRLGYTGPIDRDSFREDFENSQAPEESASAFFNEIND